VKHGSQTSPCREARRRAQIVSEMPEEDVATTASPGSSSGSASDDSVCDPQLPRTPSLKSCHGEATSLSVDDGEAASSHLSVAAPRPNSDIDVRLYACDPYTWQAYDSRFEMVRIYDPCHAPREHSGEDHSKGISCIRQLRCAEVSFEEFLANAEAAVRRCTKTETKDSQGSALEDTDTFEVFDLVICSYAMHLASESKLPVLAMNLAMAARQLLIVSPHKRPILQEKWGWRKVCEVVVERTRGVLYESTLLES